MSGYLGRDRSSPALWTRSTATASLASLSSKSLSPAKVNVAVTRSKTAVSVFIRMCRWPNDSAEWCRTKRARLQTESKFRHPLQRDCQDSISFFYAGEHTVTGLLLDLKRPIHLSTRESDRSSGRPSGTGPRRNRKKLA